LSELEFVAKTYSLAGEMMRNAYLRSALTEVSSLLAAEERRRSGTGGVGDVLHAEGLERLREEDLQILLPLSRAQENVVEQEQVSRPSRPARE
jgi:hypothetical protein